MASRSSSTKKVSPLFWFLVVFFFVTVPPISIIMLVLYFTGAVGRRKPSAVPSSEASQHLGARTGSMGSARTNRPMQAAQLLQVMQAKAKKLTLVSGILTVVFGFALAATLSNSLFWLEDGHFIWFLEDVMAPLCLFAIPFALFLVGLHRRRDVRRFRTYLAMVGQRDSVSISSLAAAAGTSQAKVLDVLEDMLDAGLFPTGYLDLSSGRLVLSGQGVSDAPKPEPPKAKAEPDPQHAMLEEIRTIRSGIDNRELCVKIDRIADITARILDYRQSTPDKADQLHSFLNYYLPTTLKILRAYAKLEDQQVSGENITAAMTRIEGMMDKIVEGFEKQLDQLFQGDALDIAADVAVLERMLAKDGLSASPLNLD